MTVHFYRPQSRLSTFVDVMWLYDGHTFPGAHERALPTGTASLIVNFAVREVSFGGLHSQPLMLETAKLKSHLGVNFRPGGAFPFLPLPSGELRDQIVGLDTLWGTQAYSMRDRLLEAATPLAKFQMMEQLMLAQLDPSVASHPAVAFALHAFHQVPSPRIEAVTDRIGLSARRLNQLFHSEVGLSPKLFQSVRRFQQVLRRLHEPLTIEWADLAVAHGYYDQSHLINDFQRFACLTPSAYRDQPGRYMNHVPVEG